MTTQYGFFIDSSRCTGCKTCELACKDFKDLGPEVSFRRIYEYAGGDWQEDNGVWHQNVFAYYLSISCNHCEDPACTKSAPAARCISVKMALWWSMKMFVSAAATAIWLVRTAHHSTMLKKAYDEVRWLLFARRRGEKPICVESCPLRALEFGPLKSCARSTALWLPLRHCRARISQNRISLSNLTPTAARPAIPLVIWLIRRKCKWEMDGMNGRWLSLPYWVNA